jgi:hypothetical protein
VLADYALLGDCHAAALVSSAGSVDWWCPQWFDAPSVFVRILGPEAGRWGIGPAGTPTITRRYVERTIVLETDMVTDHGTVRLTDALILGTAERGHRVGSESPHVLVRMVDGLSGQVDVELELLARPELWPGDAVGDRIRGSRGDLRGADRLTLTSSRPVRVEPDRGRVHASYEVGEGESIVFALHHRLAGDVATAFLEGRVALADIVAGWQSWTAAHHGYQGPYRTRRCAAPWCLRR